MPSPALLLLIATLVPLASFAVLVFMGKRMGKPLAGIVATLAIGASFVCSVLALMDWVRGGSYVPANGDARVPYGLGQMPINLGYAWLPAGAGLQQLKSGFLDVGIYIDSLTMVMFAMVSLVSLLIHVFSIGYMGEDKRFARFFTYLSLFCFSMLGLVLGSTILQLFIFWELVGLCSYLLIGFWYEKKSASDAAIKAFVVNRVGDFGFLIGFGILFYHLGNATLPNVWAMLDVSRMGSAGITLPGGAVISVGLLTVMGIGLFFGAIGKSAQFPLHVWLPDAMEGPTPVSALIHAATMVAAGVYLVGRIFPILTADARLFICIIGATTLTMAALIAIAQSDIKKVLAFSTLSQLGYMILAMGVMSWVGGLFHLITHAFFKALLFLGSGSVIQAAHHEQELPQYGGLWRKIPVTAITFGVAVLAIAGVPAFSGYYSKELILEHAGAFATWATGKHASKYLWLLFILPTVIAYVTAFYMTRCWMLTFWGKPRNEHLHEHARERAVMWLPLAMLAVLSIVGGYDSAYIKTLINSAVHENTQYVRTIDAKFDGYKYVWPAERQASDAEGEAAPSAQPAAVRAAISADRMAALEGGQKLVERYVIWAPLVGILVGVVVYSRGYVIPAMFMRFGAVRWVHTWLYRRMYFDELYMAVLVGFVFVLSKLGAIVDKHIIDGLVDGSAAMVRRLSALAGLNDKYIVDGTVNGVAAATCALGNAVRAPQTGRIRLYMTVLLGAVAAVIVAAIIILFLFESIV